MSWTQGQPKRVNQSPFIDPVNENTNPRAMSDSNGYAANARNDDYQRQTSVIAEHDVAATFTKEGLLTLSTIISSVVEAALAKTLPEFVERAVEDKVSSALHAVRANVDACSSRLVTEIVQGIQAIDKQHLRP